MKSEALSELLYIDNKKWLEEVESIHAYYKTIGSKLPNKLKEELTKLEQRLKYEIEKDLDKE
jgi:GTP-dependent phosphoenolpyruvate carboxykinase